MMIYSGLQKEIQVPALRFQNGTSYLCRDVEDCNFHMIESSDWINGLDNCEIPTTKTESSTTSTSRNA
jgi:hypothetical protein